MAQHDRQTCDESSGQWLPLTEYSVRTGVSTSTIRRKIKSNSIQYKLENGRYLLLLGDFDKSMNTMQTSPIRPTVPANTTVNATPNAAPAGAIDPAVRIVTAAYERTLREKDERLALLQRQNQELRERLDELRTLVQALEEKYEVRY
ncbi:MAG: hypothetical protein KDD51_14940 [Bdellovibrionales bacterium]|nr:hypothetical protein [Bdellovibrionales bacterium]